MPAAPKLPLNVRTRVSVWGFVVALTFASAFLWGAALALAAPLLPRQLGVFVEPPIWLIAAAFLAMSVLLFLVGVAELVRYLSPAVEVIVDGDGIVCFGLLGERRVRWGDVKEVSVGDDLLTIRWQRAGGMRQPALRIHFSRLDVAPADLLAAIKMQRPDLLP